MSRKKAYHGGSFFGWVGEEFKDLSRLRKVINADVLDAWFEPSPKVLKKIRQFLPEILKSSPPTHCEGLMRVITECRGLKIENLIVGGGSSDLMFAFFPNMIRKGEKVLILDPMYGEYAHIFENVIEADLIRHRLTATKDFRVNTKLLRDDIFKHKPKMMVLVNPNSPTGKVIKRANLLNLIKSIPKNIIVVIDETYIEYVGTGQSLEKEVAKRENLIIIKSMSKVYALSGARVAYLVGPSKIVDKIIAFIPPWQVAFAAQVAGVEALHDPSYYRKRYAETHRYRNELIKSLREVKGIKVFDSVASYFLIHLQDRHFSAGKIISKLKKKKIFLRNCDSMSNQFDDDFIRVAVRNRSENSKIAKALKDALI